MEALLSPRSLARQIEALAGGAFLQKPGSILADGISLIRPPQRISTLECAEKYRHLPAPEGGAVLRYDRWRTPYNVGPMASLDDPKCNLMVMVKPSRSGGTTVAENYLFKLMRFGPMGWVGWVLNSDEAVTDYCRTVVKPMFELNPELADRVGAGRGDNTDSFKRVSGYPVEWLSAKDGTFRNREPIFMVSDETDAWTKKYAKTPKVQIEGRQKQLGRRRKAAIMSHPDLGWNSGVAGCYEDSSRGVYVMACAECHGHAAAYATKFWGEVPEFKLSWHRDPVLSNDERLAVAERSARMTCPHCGVELDDAQRRAMVDEASRREGHGWMHRGQTLDVVEGVLGEMEDRTTHGFWVHGLMLKTVTLAELAREYEAALIKFERSKDPTQLKEFLSKALGEIFEGAATTGGVSANSLKARSRESDYARGSAPAPVHFITAAVDTGGRKFDVAWLGWDLEGRSWLLDRQTIRQRLHDDGTWRDLHLSEQIDDWHLLLDSVVSRTFPIAGRPGWHLPVAVTCLDAGDGNVTWKAREFARRALSQGYVWGKDWSRIKLIKGIGGKRAIMPEAPTKVVKDELGKQVAPITLEYGLGADKLKELTFERLSVSDGGPGQCHFYGEVEARYIDEFFGETLIDGKWVRNGPNEMLDLYGYAEAGRLMLNPDRKDIRWSQAQMPADTIWTEDSLPPWARPISTQPEGGDREAPARAGAGAAADKPKGSILKRIDALNKGN